MAAPKQIDNSAPNIDGAVKSDTLSAKIAVRNPAVAGSDPTPGLTVQSKEISSNLTSEYVSGGGYVWLATYIKSLPFYVDDLTHDLGDNLYDRMMNDPKVSGSINVYRSAVLAKGWRLTPAQIDDAATQRAVKNGDTEPSPEQKKANEICDFVERNLKAVRPGLTQVLFEMLEATYRGYKIAEMVFEYGTGIDAGKLVLSKLKTKPRHSAAFVVDVYYNVLGILGIIPGQGAPLIIESVLGDPDQMPNLLPRRKFAVLSWLPHCGDPRGNSMLRKAYNGWWTKMQTWGEYMKFNARFASPGIVIKSPENAQSQVIDGVTMSPEQIGFMAMKDYQNGGIAAVPHGYEVDILEVETNGDTFLGAINLSNLEIVTSILFQALATEEGQHQSRAASETHLDILGNWLLYGKSTVEAMVQGDMISPIVDANYADSAHLAPTFSLGETESQDVAGLMNAVSNLMRSGYLDDSQLTGMDQMIGIPIRDMQALRERRKQEQALAAQVAAQTADATVKQGARVAGQRNAGEIQNDAQEI